MVTHDIYRWIWRSEFADELSGRHRSGAFPRIVFGVSKNPEYVAIAAVVVLETVHL